MATVLNPADLYHTGFVVDDLEGAKAELSAALGVAWGVAGTADQPVVYEGRATTMTFSFAYSASDGHRIEVVQAIPGTMWTSSPDRVIHHIGYWGDDVSALSDMLAANGLPLVARIGTDQADGPVPIVMHRSPLGFYVEVVDRSFQAMLFG